MKFFVDNNLPPDWAPALTHLCRSERPTVEVTAQRKKFPPNTTDIEWIKRLGEEGGWYIVSIDRFAKGDAERQAFRESGLTCFRLESQWSKHSYWPQTQAIVRWWPRILDQARLMEGGGIIEVPFTFRGEGKFRLPTRR